MLRTVLVDCDNTLHDNKKRLLAQAKAINRFFKKNISEEQIIKDFFKTHAEVHEKHPKKHNNLLFHFKQLCTKYGQVSDSASLKKMASAWSKAFKDYYKKPAIFPDSKEFLSNIHNLGLGVFLISGSTVNERRRFLKVLRLYDYFDGIFTSNQLRTLKSDKKFYELVIKRIGRKPEEIILVGDSLEDDASAAKVGIYCIILQRNKIHKPIKKERLIHLVPDLISATKIISSKMKHSD